MVRIRCSVVTLALAAVLAACSGDDGASGPATSVPATTSVPTSTSVPATTAPTSTSAGTSTTSTTSTTRPATTTSGGTTTTSLATTTTATCPGPPFARTARDDLTVPPVAALLTAVRVANHDCYDRVVFEFDGPGLPEWRVEPAEPPFAGPSDIPVPVRGTSWLRVRFATANAHTDDGATTVGPTPVPLADATVVRQVQLIEDFEAVVVFAIGMDGPRPFRVLTFADPPRLAIDIRTG